MIKIKIYDIINIKFKFANNKINDVKLKLICSNYKSAMKAPGKQRTEKLFLLMNYLASAETLDDFKSGSLKTLTDFHELKGSLKNHFAMSITGNWRLILTKSTTDSEVIIINIVDYH